MISEKYDFYGLRRKVTSAVELKRPLCWLSLGFVFLLTYLFMGKSYEEGWNLSEKQQVLLEGKIVSKQYKDSSYGGSWQIVLKKVNIQTDEIISGRVDGKNIEKTHGTIVKQKVDETVTRRKITSKPIYSLEGKYICHLEKKEEKVFRIGQQVIISGEFVPWEEVSNPGQFDVRKWYCSQGILGQFRKCRIVKQADDYSVLREGMWKLRNWLHHRLLEELGEKDGSLISAMLLGEKSQLEEDSKNLYRRNGISHVLAISGLHLMLLGMGLFYGLKHIFGNGKGVAIVCIIIMSLYCIFTGNSISTLRATIMFVMSFLAQVLGRSYDSLSALGLAAILQLFVNPYALNNSGFLLSFLAVIGVTFISPRVQKLLGAKRNGEKSFCVSLSVSLATLPVLLCNYGTYPWYSIVLNLFIIPVMSVLLFLAVLLAFLLMISWCSLSFWNLKSGVMILEIIKTGVIYAIKAILKYMEVCCQMFEKSPFQDGYLGSPKNWQIFLYVGLLILALGSVWKHSYVCNKMILLSAVAILTMQVDFGAEITMLDVGQGDGVVIRNSNGNIYLSDCGSSSVSQVGKYRLIPFLKYKGYSKIQGIFISHLDEDHINGILELLDMAKEERIRICYLFLPENVCEAKEDEETLEEIQILAEKNQIEIKFLQRGEMITDGKMQFFCIHPKGEGIGTNRNNQSLVLSLKHESFEMLLTGDVEKEGEMEIIQYIDRIGLLPQYDVLKVAHHGSSGSGSEAFLKAVNPKVSLISCGKNNSYGHPHEETLERLEEVGSEVLSTTKSGAITLKLGRKVRVYEFRK